ncbi:hypothetical protein BT96DRAFT_946731 [Gymnopus androsaceus JB14]|uniref:Uncharacterized protein n=1 Tax=Gymnopus androsaceus JB14 TaxID=1447944 RepID=A0A6A4GV25_9AGAR|nr:hypothetical protein BT96DRAFT_946731 [Gymnopus androsaceus JB14]
MYDGTLYTVPVLVMEAYLNSIYVINWGNVPGDLLINLTEKAQGPMPSLTQSPEIKFANNGLLTHHAKICWGDKAVKAIQESNSLNKVHSAIKQFRKKSQNKLNAALQTVKG